MAEKTEKVGNAKAAVQAAKIIQGAATAGLPGAAIATISDPKASFALVKKILIAVTVIIMLPTIIISSIPSSIINLISIDQTQDSSSSQVFKSKYDEFLTGFQEALSDDLSEDIECREFKANVCVLISYYSIWKDKKIIPISSSKLVSDFKKRIKKAFEAADEVDKSSDNQIFLSFLGLLREKYLKCQQGKDVTFHSVILAGVYDIKTLKLKLHPQEESKYNSLWNIADNNQMYMKVSSDRNQFIVSGMLQMPLAMQKFYEYYEEIYSEKDQKFIEENGRKLLY